MADLWKHRVGAGSISQLADAIKTVDDGFAAAAFVAAATAGLDDLELKARVGHIAGALDRYLTGPFERAARVLVEAAERGELNMWSGWPVLTYVEQYGLGEPDAALAALARLTRYASAEFAIRPYIDKHPDVTFERLREWASSDDVHVRRLVSEGTRPRLPWGRQLVALRRDPTPVIPLLDRLRDDSEEYVRRSVANHLNDIAKDDPDLAVAIARRWLREGGSHVDRVVRHGLRTLVKVGRADALALVGADTAAELTIADLQIENNRIQLGETLRFSFRVGNATDEPARVIVDYVIHLRRANGSLSPKVFKLTTRTLPPNSQTAFRRDHAIRPVSARRYYPGTQVLEIQVNGRGLARVDFELLD